MALSDKVKNLLLSALGSPEATNELITEIESSVGSVSSVTASSPLSSSGGSNPNISLSIGSDKQVIFNDGGLISSDPHFMYNKSLQEIIIRRITSEDSQNLGISSGNSAAGASGVFNLLSGTPAINFNSGSFNTFSNNASGTGISGDNTVGTGNTVNGNSGNVVIYTGDSSGTGHSGDLVLTSGASSSGRGNIKISAPTLLLQGNQINMGTAKIINVVNPTNPQDAATKSYVDSKVSGASGTFTTADSKTVTVLNGIITSIV